MAGELFLFSQETKKTFLSRTPRLSRKRFIEPHKNKNCLWGKSPTCVIKENNAPEKLLEL